MDNVLPSKMQSVSGIVACLTTYKKSDNTNFKKSHYQQTVPRKTIHSPQFIILINANVICYPK